MMIFAWFFIFFSILLPTVEGEMALPETNPLVVC